MTETITIDAASLECAKVVFNTFFYQTLAFHLTGFAICFGCVMLLSLPSLNRR